MQSSMSNEALYVENEGLIWFVIRKKIKGSLPLREREDILQELRIGLWKAILTFESDRGSFSTWAVQCILNEYRMYMVGKNRMKRKLDHIATSLNQKVITENDEMELINCISCSLDTIDSLVNWNMMLEKLSADDLELIRLFSTIENQEEIGKILGGTQRMVSHRKSVLLKKIKKELAG